MTIAMTFPPGTHAMWNALLPEQPASIHPGDANGGGAVSSLSPCRHQQMVANMEAGKMPTATVSVNLGNARAIADGIGFTSINTQGIWKDHPGRNPAPITAEFADKNTQ
jgi:nitrate/nitrite transport system substrate-binding protein